MRIQLRQLVLMLVVALVIGAGAMRGYELLVPAKDPEAQKLMDAYETLQERYFRKPDKAKLMDDAINGMLQSLNDPYTTYMNQKEAQSFLADISASYVGIGATVKTDASGHIVIVEPQKDSPALKAGLKPNDILLKADGVELTGMKLEDALGHIKGKEGTKVDFEVKRIGAAAPLHIIVTRSRISVNTVNAEMLSGGVGRIVISKMAEPTSKQFADALKSLQAKGMKGLVLDLRQNPGGLVREAVAIADMLIPKDKIIFKEKFRDGSTNTYKAENGTKLNIPVVALIDENSASAAEIVAGALKESGNIPLVGVKSFGKGIEQTQRSYKDGSLIKYTVADWLTPSGKSIHKKGIVPDYKVSMPAYAAIPYVNPNQELKPDTFSDDIKSMQRMLKAIGIDPGREDGFYDDQTKAAVMTFQRAHSLTQSGTMTGETINAIMGVLHDQIVQNDSQLKKGRELVEDMMKK